MFSSIRWRLVLTYVVLTLLTVSMVGILALALIGQYVRQRETENLTANADAVAGRALPLLWPLVQQTRLQELAQTASFLGNSRVKILDADHRLLADSRLDPGRGNRVWVLPSREWWNGDSDGGRGPLLLELLSVGQTPFLTRPDEAYLILEQLAPEDTLAGVRWWQDAWGVRFGFYGPEELEGLGHAAGEQSTAPRSGRVVSVPIGEPHDPLGFVQISEGPDFGGEALATARRALLLAAVGATLMAVAVGLLVSRRLSDPLRELAEVAGRMSGGDLSSRAPVRGRDEIGQLAGQFNQMAERLEDSFAELAGERDALRRFIADASHELRTPVTALKSFNELLQGAAAKDPAAQAEFLAESQIQLERLDSILLNLLALSRLDAGLITMDMADHDVGELLLSVAATFRPLAQVKGIALSVHPPDVSTTLRCDRARIELALSNLLDNGIKYAPAGGKLSIGAVAGDDHVRLWVQDSGPGIAPEDQPHIFERFYRGRDSRTDGSGLGLAIVRSIVQAHGGRAAVQSKPGAGSLFVIDLPAG